MYNRSEKLLSISSTLKHSLTAQISLESSNSALSEQAAFNNSIRSETIKYGVNLLRSGLLLAPLVLAFTLSGTGEAKAADNASQIGYVGCSMTVGAVEGYQELGGTSLWESASDSYGGGGVSLWGDIFDITSQYWSWFEDSLANYQSTSVIWWQLCALDDKDGTDEELLENARAVRDEIKRRVPEATIYVSAQPSYSDPNSSVAPVCRIAGAKGPQRMEELAAKLVAEGGVEQGPVIGPLTPDMLVEDGCHGNDDGELFMGQQLADFYGLGDGDTDSDGDSVSDSIDNCPTISNSDQADTDGDGVGDVCESTPSSPLMVSPNQVMRGTQTTIELAGQGFDSDMTVSILPYPAGVRIESLTINSPTSATVILNVASIARQGGRGVKVVTSDGQTVTSQFAFRVQ